MVHTGMAYRKYAAAWHHILWEADYDTQLAFRLVSRDFAAAVDDILCGTGLAFAPLGGGTAGDIRATSRGVSLPFFHPDGPTASQIKAVQKARVLVFAADDYPPTSALIAHAAHGTRVALAHRTWWRVGISIPSEVPEVAFLFGTPCLCDPDVPPPTTVSHTASAVDFELDLSGASAKCLPKCHLFSRWWTPSVRTLRISLAGPLAAMKAVPRLLLSGIAPGDRGRLSVSVKMRDVVLTKLDHRWMDKEFELLGVEDFELTTFDRRTGAVAHEKHRCYEFEWAYLDHHAEAMHEAETVEEQRYVPPSKRNSGPAMNGTEPATATGQYLPPGKRQQAAAAEKMAALLTKAMQCKSDLRPDSTHQPSTGHEAGFVPPWRRPGAIIRSYIDPPLPADEYVDMPDHIDQVPIALGGAHYALGSCRFVLGSEIIHQADLMDARYQPLHQQIDLESWTKRCKIWGTSFRDPAARRRTTPQRRASDSSSDSDSEEVDAEESDDSSESPALDPVEGSDAKRQPHDGSPGPRVSTEQHGRNHNHALQRMRSWASISSSSGASVAPIDL